MSEPRQEMQNPRGLSKRLAVVIVAGALGVGGVVAARAATAGATVTVCASKSSGALRYSKDGRCKSTEIRLVLGQTGPIGPAGPTGPTGATGLTGASGSVSPVTINSQTGSGYTLVLADAGKFITASSTTAILITIPTNASVAFPIGTKIELGQVGSSGLHITPSAGVTLNGGSVFRSFDSGSYQYGVLLKIATDSWVLLLPVPMP